MKARRAILSLLLCSAMLFSLCAQPVFAEADPQAQDPVNHIETGSEDGLGHKVNDSEIGKENGLGRSGQTVAPGAEAEPEAPENSETQKDPKTNPEISENPEAQEDPKTNPEMSENPEAQEDTETNPVLSQNPETMPEAADSVSGNAAASATTEKQETETQENPEAPEDPEIIPEMSKNPETQEDMETNPVLSQNPETSEDMETQENPEAPLPAKMGAMRAAARAADINMQYDNFVFAQGLPIVIKQNGSITSVYSVNDELLSGDTDVSSSVIYGGWFDSNNEHAADTSVTMESGTIQALFGGSYSGTLTGSTSVVVNGGVIINEVFGGGNSSSIEGSTRVEIKGGTMTSVFGGGYAEEISGSTCVEVSSGTVDLEVYGGGGGNSSVYGGTEVKVNGGMVGSVFGGGYEGTVTGGTSVAIDGAAQIIGTVYGGGNNATVDDSQVEIKGGTMTSVFGGGYQGAVTGNAAVTVISGTIGDSVYGGGNEAAAKSTRLIFDGGTANQIYGGGFGSGSTVEAASLELKRGACDQVYGGGRNPGSSVKQTTVTLGPDWGYTKQVFAGGSFDAVTNASQVIIQNYATQSGQSDFLTINAETAGDSQVVIRRNEGGPSGSANTSTLNLTPTGVKKIVVEYGQVTLLGQKGLELRLDSLDIQAGGQVRFQDWDTAVIQKLSGSGGQLLFPAQFLSGTTNIVNRPVTVGEISVAAPLIIKAEGTGWGSNLDDFYFFQGAGVDALTSADCFFSEGYEVVLRQIPDQGGAKGVYLRQKEAEKPVYISKLEFNQNPVAYNGTISLTVGVGVQLTTADKLELIPSARIQIRGSNDRNVLFADIQVSDDGKSATVTGVDGVTSPAQVDNAYITITLPVNADLLDTCQEGLSMIATAPNQYSSTAQLVGPHSETKIEITPTPITLTKTIPDPDSQDPVEGELEEGAFYTAGFRWHPADGSAVSAFVPDLDYWADIILSPKEGHWLTAASIGDTVTYDGKAVSCVFNADGTVTLKNMKSVRFAGYRTIVALSSPMKGGTVTGGGSYASDSQATVKALPAEGWHFVKWTEGGIEVSVSADYTFTVTGNRTLVAVFEKDDEPHTPSYVPNDLTDCGVTLLGDQIHENARLTVTKDRLHNSGGCGYCDRIRQWQEQGRVIAIYDVSLSHGFQGNVTLTFPVSQEYNGKTLTVVHCLRDKLDAWDVTASNGEVRVTVNSLSPFAILDYPKEEPGKDNPNTDTGTGTDTGAGTADRTNQTSVQSPQTGDSGVTVWAVSGVCALLAALIVGTATVTFKRRGKTKNCS